MSLTDLPAWRKPGYKGKLKPTPWIPGQPDYLRPQFTIEDAKETIMQLHTAGSISKEKVHSLLNRYNKLEKAGQYYL